MRRLLVAGAFALLAASLASSTAAFATTANDEITGAISIGPVPYSTSVDFAGATYAETDPVCPEKAAEDRLAYPSLWYKITPTIGGRIDVHLASSGTDWYAGIGVYTGSPGSLQQQACAYDTYYNQNEGRSVAGFVATAGTTYYVTVSAYSHGDPVAYTLQLTPPSWHDWVSVGGSLSTFPECQPDPNNAGEEECWARSSAATLLWAHGEPDYFSMDRDLGGSIGGPPTCVVRTVRVDCFAVSSTNHLAWITYSGSGWRWNGWTDLGGTVTGRPSCIPVGSLGIECYVGSPSNAVYRWAYNGSYWSGPTKIGGSTVVRPQCVVRSGTDCFIVDAKGVLYQNHLTTAGKAGTWQKLATGFGLAPQCINTGGKLDCFAQSRTHQLLKGFYNGSSWAAWTNLGGNVASEPACYKTSSTTNPDFDCFWTDGGFHLVEKQRLGGTWQAEQNLGGAVQQGPSCVITADGHKDCYARGTNNALWQKSFY